MIPLEQIKITRRNQQGLKFLVEIPGRGLQQKQRLPPS